MKQKSFKHYIEKVHITELNYSKAVQYYVSFSEKVKIKHEEVPVFDSIGLLSSLGGALGLFIGFSFFGYIASIADVFVDKGFKEVLKRYK